MPGPLASCKWATETHVGDKGRIRRVDAGELSRAIHWEARRVAEAFGIKDWSSVPVVGSATRFGFTGECGGIDGEDGSRQEEAGGQVGVALLWMVAPGVRVDYLCLGDSLADQECSLLYDRTLDRWKLCSQLRHAHLLACGLYCLGIVADTLAVEFDLELSLEQKEQLRLTLPREFWPKAWLEEEEMDAAK